MGRNRMSLTVDAVLAIRDMAAERKPGGQARYSYAEIAKMMDCGETTVFRVVNRQGAYAFVGGMSMGEVKADPAKDAELQRAAAASLAKLQKMLEVQTETVPEPEPEFQLSPELEAKAQAIRDKLVKKGNY